MRSPKALAALLLITLGASCGTPRPRPLLETDLTTAPQAPPAKGDLAAAMSLESGCELRHATARGTSSNAAVPDQHGSDAPGVPGSGTETPLHLAARLGRLEAAQALIDQGAAVDARTARGWTPLHLVAGSGDHAAAMATLLLRHGADVNAKGRDAWTPLLAAVVGRRADVVAVLLRYDAIVDAREAMLGGASPLELAVSLGAVPIAELLIAAGADIDSRNRAGGTALHAAALAEQHEAVALLLREGADPNARDARGATPLHMAAGCGCDAADLGKTAVAKLLIQHGASVDIRDQNGLTALDVAIAYADQPLVDLLRRTPPTGGYAECFRT